MVGVTISSTPLPDDALIDSLVTLAAHLAATAGTLVRDGRPDEVIVADTKSSPIDVVTAMDTDSEMLLRRLISAARPHDGILGEEGDAVPGTSGLTWVVDPIDGTVNYLYGLPSYAVSVAVVAGEPDPESWVPIAGCVYRVHDGASYTAGRGRGSYLDGRRLTVNDAHPLSHSLVSTGFGYTVERRRAQGAVVAALLPRVRDIRRIGSAALDLCAVASGNLDLHYERGLKPWDMAAGQLIAMEAGAVVTGLHGRPATEQMTVAGPAASVAELVALLEVLGADDGP